MLGKGSFGIVVKATRKGNANFAIKVLHNLPEFYSLGLEEISILKRLSHPSIVKYVHHFMHQGHLCIVTELLGLSLFETLKGRKYKGFSLNVIANITQQILSALKYLKSKRIMHADVKPENVLFVEEFTTQIKLIDFGSSCVEPKYNYIQSRFYRSPEVLLAFSCFGPEIDMFSLGCMVTELYTGKPLLPGSCEHSQILMITKLLGKPPQYILQASNSDKVDNCFDCFYNPIPCLTKRGRVEGCDSIKGIAEVQAILGKLLNLRPQHEFVSFISSCLTWDPTHRISPAAALDTKFIRGPKSTQLLNV